MKQFRLKIFRLKTVVFIVMGMLFIPGTQAKLNAAFLQDNTNTSQVQFKQYKGEVIDEATKKPLVFATLTLEGTNISTVTNTEGDFVLKIPNSINTGNVVVAFLGYKSSYIPLEQLQDENNVIRLTVSVTELSAVNIVVPKNARNLVKETFRKRADNYFVDPTLMTAFYRETIKKKKKKCIAIGGCGKHIQDPL